MLLIFPCRGTGINWLPQHAVVPCGKCRCTISVFPSVSEMTMRERDSFLELDTRLCFSHNLVTVSPADALGCAEQHFAVAAGLC